MNFNQKKSVQAINFFTRREDGASINRLKLMKILWLADKLHLLRYGRFILEDSYVAMPNGPVPTNTIDISRGTGDEYISKYIQPKKYVIHSKEEVEIKFFSESEIEVMNEVWDYFGGIGHFTLADLSHHYPEWKKFEENINDSSQPNAYKMSIDDFFETPKNESFEEAKYEFFMKEDVEFSKEIYNETKVI